MPPSRAPPNRHKAPTSLFGALLTLVLEIVVAVLSFSAFTLATFISGE
jgi:hypothetical protein